MMNLATLIASFQTLEVLRLQTELEEYEYEDANE